MVGVEPGRPAAAPRAGDHHRAAGPGQRDGLGERSRGLGGDVHDDVGAATPASRPQPRHGILGVHVDGEVGAEATGLREPGMVALARAR